MCDASGARYSQRRGRHMPRCGGRCLVANLKGDDDASGASAALIVMPTTGFLCLLATKHPFVAVLVCALAATSLTFLARAKCTEPGILPPAPPDDADIEAAAMSPRRMRVTHVLVRGEKRGLADHRAKVCRQTENCVEAFDHYCPWVGNAVGRRNYRFFVGFVVSTAALALVVGATSTAALLKSHPIRTRRPPNPSTVVALACLVLYTAVVFLSVGSLAVYHLGLVAVNQTTNEDVRGVYPTRADNPHDRGCRRNWLAFLQSGSPPSIVLELDEASAAAPRRKAPRRGDSDEARGGLLSPVAAREPDGDVEMALRVSDSDFV